MPEIPDADGPEPMPISNFELSAGKTHLRMENVSERVQLAVVWALSGISVGVLAVTALAIERGRPRDDMDGQPER
ncbi:hypothetical protein ACFC60_18780 [Kitasatospora purpeofusca]|uniref:hypothetical protein n=1 Tax=Kitasatospora purpeofusca TaxID=67352 RepID=UPI0035DAA0D3